jgi:hypothetical protein
MYIYRPGSRWIEKIEALYEHDSPKNMQNYPQSSMLIENTP